MKNSKMIRLMAVLLLIVTIAVIAISGTYARYITTVGGTDTARVAHWKINTTNSIADLFAASYTNVVNADADGTAVIAPGTSGSYTFAIEGTVETAYTLKVEATGTDAVNGAVNIDESTPYDPIKYTFQKNSDAVVECTSFSDLLSKINAIDNGTTTHTAGTLSGDTYTIGWSWAIDGNDAKDTELGNLVASGDRKVNLTVNITATQVAE